MLVFEKLIEYVIRAIFTYCDNNMNGKLIVLKKDIDQMIVTMMLLFLSQKSEGLWRKCLV